MDDVLKEMVLEVDYGDKTIHHEGKTYIRELTIVDDLTGEREVVEPYRNCRSGWEFGRRPPTPILDYIHGYVGDKLFVDKDLSRRLGGEIRRLSDYISGIVGYRIVLGSDGNVREGEYLRYYIEFYGVKIFCDPVGGLKEIPGEFNKGGLG